MHENTSNYWEYAINNISGQSCSGLLQNKSGLDPSTTPTVDTPHQACLQLDLRRYGIHVSYAEYGNTQWLWQ